jgi:hypothetical protein
LYARAVNRLPRSKIQPYRISATKPGVIALDVQQKLIDRLRSFGGDQPQSKRFDLLVVLLPTVHVARVQRLQLSGEKGRDPREVISWEKVAKEKRLIDMMQSEDSEYLPIAYELPGLRHRPRLPFIEFA